MITSSTIGSAFTILNGICFYKYINIGNNKIMDLPIYAWGSNMREAINKNQEIYYAYYDEDSEARGLIVTVQHGLYDKNHKPFSRITAEARVWTSKSSNGGGWVVDTDWIYNEVYEHKRVMLADVARYSEDAFKSLMIQYS